MGRVERDPELGATYDAAAPALSELTLGALRSYRRLAREEEERVSYWRRLVQSRLDLLDRSAELDEVPMRTLVRSLGPTGTGSRRQQLLNVAAHDELPGLPRLYDVWTAAVDPHDVVEASRLRAALEEAEGQLSAYRSALHARIDSSTEELVRRYQADPSLALELL
jgi:hypothetical protein